VSGGVFAQKIGIMPRPEKDHPSLLKELYIDDKISEQVMSFWKDRVNNGIFVTFGKLDLDVITKNQIEWVDLLPES